MGSSELGEDAAPSYAYCDSEEVTEELSKLNSCPGPAKRVRLPPPLCRIHSQINGICLSSPESLSTTARSSSQASPCEMASMPNSTSDGQSTTSSCCGSLQGFSPRFGHLWTPHDRFAEPSVDTAHRASSLILQHCHTEMPEQILQSMLPSSSASIGHFDPLLRSSARAHAATRNPAREPRQVLGMQNQLNCGAATDVMPLYVFPCTPEAGCQPVHDACAFAGLLQPQMIAVDPFVKVGACSVAGVSSVTSVQNLQLGCPVLPSIGSAGHHKGSCKPCAFGGVAAGTARVVNFATSASRLRNQSEASGS